MPFLEHVRELRARLFVSVTALSLCSCLAFFFYDPIIRFFLKPFNEMTNTFGEGGFVIASIMGGFLTKIKVSLFSGMILSLPVHIYGAVRFIFPGLTSKEKKFVGASLCVSTILIFVGLLFSYELLLPISITFLTSELFAPGNVSFLPEFGKAIFYIFQIIFGTILVFQFPLVILFLIIFKVVSIKGLLKSSRYLIVGIFILSAILTPPDPTTQLLVSLPLIVLFYLSIFIAKIFKLGIQT